MQNSAMMFRKNAPAAPEANLVAWYRAENNALDSSGNDLHATAGSATDYGNGYTGDPDSAFDFGTDGTTAGLPNTGLLTPQLNLGSSYTIEFWAYRYENFGNTYHHLISKAYNSGSSNFGALYWVNTGIQYWHGGNAITSVSSQNLVPGVWYKFKLTYDELDSKSRIYIDDVLNATEVGTHEETFSDSVGIGRANPLESRIFNGRIDEVKFYDALI